MRVDATHDEAVLHAIGATRVSEVRDEEGVLIGRDVTPDIDLADYATAAASVLATLKGDLKREVDAKAEALRLTLITPGSGQAMEYQEAYAQAQAALAATDTVKPSDYPMLAATIGVDIDPNSGKPATDVLGVARSVKTAYEGYLQAGAAIRGVRLLAKAEIDAAGDADHARAVFEAIKWPALG